MTTDFDATALVDSDVAKMGPPEPVRPIAIRQPAQAPVFWSSWPIQTEEDKVRLLTVLMGEQLDLKELPDKTELLLVAAATQEIPENERTGREDFEQCLLLCQDGKVYKTGGSGSPKRVKLMSVAHGADLWDPPIRVRLDKIQCGQPSPFLQLTYLGRNLTPSQRKEVKGEPKK